MHGIWDVIDQGSWIGKDVTLVAGGTSLYDFDFDCLTDPIRVGANECAFKARCDVLVSLDWNYVGRNAERIQWFCEDGGEAIIAVPAPYVDDYRDRIPLATFLERVRGPRMATRPHQLAGLNSGFATLGVALHRKADNIKLIGFDMCHGRSHRGGTHFFGGYGPGKTQSSPRFLYRWAHDFIQAKQDLDAAGIGVVNYIGEPVSKITAFETRPLEELHLP